MGLLVVALFVVGTLAAGHLLAEAVEWAFRRYYARSVPEPGPFLEDEYRVQAWASESRGPSS